MIEGITAGYLLKQVKDMIFAVGKLRAADQKAADDIAKINRRLKDNEKRIEKGEKIQGILTQEVAELQQQVAALTGELRDANKEKHGLKSKLGKAKAENARLKQ